VGRRDIRDVLGYLRSRGKTVFVNSHLLSELEMISDRVAILIGGQVAMQGTIGDLTLKKQRYEIDVQWIGDQTSANLAAAISARVVTVAIPPPPIPPGRMNWGPPPAARILGQGSLADGTWVEIEGPMLRVGLLDPAAIQPIVDQLRRAGLIITRVQSVRPTLEDLFIEAVGIRQQGGTL